ncbi:MAG: SAM-dependent methyltransferase [Flavobacteriales bacterium]
MYAVRREGTLYLMPVWLGDAGGMEQLPPENAEIASRITLYFCEHERTARQMLRRMVPDIALGSLELHRLDKDTSGSDARALLAPLIAGRDGVILSEAGMPGIADPGALLVQAAHQAGITVRPLIGPSSLVLALAASGLNGQCFTFHGYLPRDVHERRTAIKRIEQEAMRNGAAHLFIETPYRNDAMLDELLRSCQHGTLLTVATDLTQPEGSVSTRSIGDWKAHPITIGKRPTVFIIGSRP